MIDAKVISYDPADIVNVLDGFRAERGFLGILPSLISDGLLFGVIANGGDIPDDLESGYAAPLNSREYLLVEVLGCLNSLRPKYYLTAQDIWALENDYNLNIMNGIEKSVLEGSVYIKIDENDIRNSISKTLRKTISSTSVFIAIDVPFRFRSTKMLGEHAMLAAVEAFDGQGWLLWVRKDISAIIRLIDIGSCLID